MCDCNNRLADIASMGARQFSFAPEGVALDLNQEALRRRILSPYNQLLFVSFTKTLYTTGPVRLPIPPTTHI